MHNPSVENFVRLLNILEVQTSKTSFISIHRIDKKHFSIVLIRNNWKICIIWINWHNLHALALWRISVLFWHPPKFQCILLEFWRVELRHQLRSQCGPSKEKFVCGQPPTRSFPQPFNSFTFAQPSPIPLLHCSVARFFLKLCLIPNLQHTPTSPKQAPSFFDVRSFSFSITSSPQRNNANSCKLLLLKQPICENLCSDPSNFWTFAQIFRANFFFAGSKLMTKQRAQNFTMPTTLSFAKRCLTFVPPFPFPRITHQTAIVSLSRRRAHPPCTPLTPSMTASPSSPPSTSEEDEDIPDVHASWHVYSLPGNKCVLCRGEGHVKCLFCYGEGTVRIGAEDARDTISCPQCDGSSRELCTRCQGSGQRPTTRYDVETDKYVRNLTNEEVSRGLTLADIAEGTNENKTAENDAELEENVEQILWGLPTPHRV